MSEAQQGDTQTAERAGESCASEAAPCSKVGRAICSPSNGVRVWTVDDNQGCAGWVPAPLCLRCPIWGAGAGGGLMCEAALGGEGSYARGVAHPGSAHATYRNAVVFYSPPPPLLQPAAGVCFSTL